MKGSRTSRLEATRSPDLASRSPGPGRPSKLDEEVLVFRWLEANRAQLVAQLVARLGSRLREALVGSLPAVADQAPGYVDALADRSSRVHDDICILGVDGRRPEPLSVVVGGCRPPIRSGAGR